MHVIVTVTPAPAIDWTVACEDFRLQAVNRAETVAREPSGKGVNVTIALTRAGIKSVAIVPLGGPSGDLFRASAREENLALEVIATDSDCRQNITVRESSGADTKINFPGAPMSPPEWQALTETLRRVLTPGDVLVLAGSLPTGVSDDAYRELVALGHDLRAQVAVDTSGPALTAALSAGPDLVTPNHHELADELGMAMSSLADVERGCEVLRERGARAVLTSLGARGAYYQDQDHRLYGYITGVTPTNSVGAGDALLAGMIAEPTPPALSLARALEWGSSAVESPTTLFDLQSRPTEQIHVSSHYDQALTLT